MRSTTVSGLLREMRQDQREAIAGIASGYNDAVLKAIRTDIVDALGISRASVFRIIAENASGWLPTWPGRSDVSA